jgi:hypothetical protein
MQNTFGIVRLHAMQNHQRKARQAYVCQRLLETGAKASHAGQNYMDSATVDGLREGVIEAFRTIASAAGAHPNCDPGNGWYQFCQSRLAHSTEGANVLNSRHQ